MLTLREQHNEEQVRPRRDKVAGGRHFRRFTLIEIRYCTLRYFRHYYYYVYDIFRRVISIITLIAFLSCQILISL